MPLADHEIISAQVVLRSASGKVADGNTNITSANISEYAPDQTVVADALKRFKAAGFETGTFVGTSFSITATVGAFQHMFGTKLKRLERGDILAVRGHNSGTYELPLDKLPPDIARQILTVTFTPPPDFGPTLFS